jgi:hypothetical protein
MKNILQAPLSLSYQEQSGILGMSSGPPPMRTSRNGPILVSPLPLFPSQSAVTPTCFLCSPYEGEDVPPSTCHPKEEP